MSRTSVLLAALTSEPTSTSALYQRVGYAALTRVGLVPYGAFRSELAKLTADGRAESGDAPDGSTTWRLTGLIGPGESRTLEAPGGKDPA